MCEPISISLGAAGAVAAIAGGITMAAVDYDTTQTANEDMQDALDAQYEAETRMVNEQFILDQQNLEAQTIQEMEDQGATGRDKEAEARRMRANAEAALSGLNVGGVTGLRTLGAFDIMGTELEGEANVAKQRVLKQYHANEDENQQNRMSGYKGAEKQRHANFNPKRQTSIATHGVNITKAGVDGGIAGTGLGLAINRALKEPSKKT